MSDIKKNIHWAIAVLGASILLGTSVNTAAQEGPRDHRPPRDHGARMFDRLDSDGDGKVSFDEASARMPRMDDEHFGMLDKDSDGFLTQGELPRPRRGEQGERGERRGRDDGRFFQRLDENKDGKVSFEEFSSVNERITREHFSRLDSDSNGSLTQEEFAEARTRRPGGDRDRRHRGPDGGQPGDAADLFKDGDTDSSGSLSYEEMTAHRPHMTRQRFNRIDLNSDGELSHEELTGRRPPRHGFPHGQNKSD